MIMSNILFKYLDVDGAKTMLRNRNLMYANASTFNDPFDCHPSLIDFSNVPQEMCKVWSAQDIEELKQNRHLNYRNELWICCLSKLYNSILMWSYYNKHEGVCIGLNMDHVSKYLNTQLGMIVSTRGQSVQYKDIINKPNFYQNNQDVFSYQIFTKAKAWEHEQEVRLFIYKPSPFFMKLLPFQKGKNNFDSKEIRTFVNIGAECFDSIYFGVKIAKDSKEKILNIVKELNPKIKVYQMETDPKAFNLIEKQENL